MCFSMPFFADPPPPADLTFFDAANIFSTWQAENFIEFY